MCKISIRLKEHENVSIRGGGIYVLFGGIFPSLKKKWGFFFHKFKVKSFQTFAICGYMNYE